VVELKGGIKLARGGWEDYPGIRGRTDGRPNYIPPFFTVFSYFCDIVPSQFFQAGTFHNTYSLVQSFVQESDTS
jgi:hypothetical protein